MNAATKVLRLGLLATSLAAACDAAAAQDTRLPLSYGDAQARLLDQSDAIDAADAAVRAAEARLEATRTLGRPEVDIEAQVLDFQKTLYLPLGSLEPVANSFGINDPLRFRIRRFVSRPIVTATVPIYSGGRMGAAKTQATSNVAIEFANRDEASQQALAQLARAYFGRQLAAQALAIRQDVAEGIRAHVQDARALEREQQIAPAQRLQAEAQYEQALREAEMAAADLAAADIALAGMLRVSATVEPTTRLVVSERPLPPRETFLAHAMDNHPGLNRLEANVRLAGAGVAAEQAELRPTV